MGPSSARRPVPRDRRLQPRPGQGRGSRFAAGARGRTCAGVELGGLSRPRARVNAAGVGESANQRLDAFFSEGYYGYHVPFHAWSWSSILPGVQPSTSMSRSSQWRQSGPILASTNTSSEPAAGSILGRVDPALASRLPPCCRDSLSKPCAKSCVARARATRNPLVTFPS